MSQTFSFQLMQPGQEIRVCDLIIRVFEEWVAPDFSPNGVQEFLKYVQPDALRERSQANHFALVAAMGDAIVGVIEIRNHEHVSLFFVDQEHMGEGIGRELWRRALDICRRENPDVREISVNSSPYAVPIYEKLGFRQTEPERVVDGILFIPMAIELSRMGGRLTDR